MRGVRIFLRSGATAPRLGNTRGRASRVCAVPGATLKQASCDVSPVARPLAAPAEWETAFGGLGNLGKPQGGLKSGWKDLIQAFSRGTFLSREAGFPIGWRRCNASHRRSSGRMRARTQIRLLPAECGRSSAPPPASLVARSAQPRTCARLSFNAEKAERRRRREFFGG